MADLALDHDLPLRNAMRGAFLAALTLAGIGLLTMLAVTTMDPEDPYVRFRRQALYLLGALLAGGVTFALGYRRMARWSRPLLWLTWALLLVLLVPGMPRQYGASRWIALGPIHVQPSEIAKLTMIVFLSALAATKGANLQRFREGFLPAMGYVGLTAVFVLRQPDLGQTLLIIAISTAVLMVNGLRFVHFLPIGLFAAPCLVYLMSTRFGYVRSRLDQFLGQVDPSSQVGQGLGALMAGGLFGRGLGEGRAHLHFVPKVHNDFVLVAIGEHAGLFGTLIVVILFLIFFGCGLRIAFAARDGLGFSIAFGVSFMIALQAAVNVAVATRSVPPKGMSLPFVSYGGSGLLVCGAAVGLLLSVAHAALRGAPEEPAVALGALERSPAPEPRGALA